MTAFITGVCGFAGRHLAAHLLGRGVTVCGTYLDAADRRGIGPLGRHVGLHKADVRDLARLRSILRRTRPDVVYHLAAQASVGSSFASPVGTVDVNVSGTAALLEAVRHESPRARVLFASTAEVYGKVRPRDVALSETHPVAPRNPYAASKLAAEELCRQYARTWDLRVVIARSFNHTGPGQALGFVIPDFASQIARLERGRGRARMKVGNLNARRDLSDVRDIVRGYDLLVRKGRPGEVYHLGTGRAHRIADLLTLMLALARRPVDVVPDPARRRPSDVPVLAASVRKVRRQTGWRVTIPLARTLADTLEYWRSDGH